MSGFDLRVNAGEDIADLHDEWKKEDAMSADKITPEQLREWASRCEARLDPTSDPAQLRAHAAALEELSALREQLAERDAEIAALKGHAEAMCRILQMGDGGFDRPETAAYRAAYPKE